MSENRTNKIDLGKLKRDQLLEMLIEQGKENQRLRQELEKAKEEQKDKSMTFIKAGSLAEASLEISQVFQTAQKAADHYLENVRTMEEESRKKYNQIIAKAHKESNEHWEKLSQKLEDFYDSHQGLREMLAMDVFKETEE